MFTKFYTIKYRNSIVLITLIALIVGGVYLHEVTKAKINFTAQVKPIINKNCISCHGGVKQKGGFSLLFRDEALAKTTSGKPAIIPGEPSESEMIRRLTLKDPEERMPYKHDALSKQDIDILTQWVEEGANWGNHWAYLPLTPTEVPASTTFFGWFKTKSNWAKNEIDYFIEDKRKETGLSPSAQADKQTLLRRVSLDIIGMPAPQHLAKKYLEDDSDKAYPQLVDSLLAQKSYGEKWTSLWLDVARYADSKGYEKDNYRNIWQYRDWLINAFNSDMPYNTFLTKQIAGDLLPNATDNDYIATAFQRNTLTNDEAGTDDEEFRVAAVMDRVNTIWQATMSTTFACVQCHSHPYDPFKHKDYYKFIAYYNNSKDQDNESDMPLLRQYKGNDITALNEVVNWFKQNTNKTQALEVELFLKTMQPCITVVPVETFTKSEIIALNNKGLKNTFVYKLSNVNLTNKTQIIYNSGYREGDWEIHIDKPDGIIIGKINTKAAKVNIQTKLAQIKPTNGIHDIYFVFDKNKSKDPNLEGGKIGWFVVGKPLNGFDKPGFEAIKKKYWNLINANVETTPIMLDNAKDVSRVTQVFERGNWMVKGDVVTPEIPKSLNTDATNYKANRLGLANWLTSSKNPLVSRTMINRIWEQIFGIGIVETLEDMGSQGSSPTHIELLNWLSYQFMHQNQWSIKKTIKTIVLSATYQQSSVITDKQKDIDLSNKYYARYSRIRLSAEQIRDQALAISGLLSTKMYGPSVFPYQPEGIWQTPYDDYKWKKSIGQDQYRRAVYTYWKRSSSYPSMLTFDGVSRVICTVRRIRTNTPLQALTMLNDSSYLEISHNFARRMKAEGGSLPINQIKKGYFLATYKTPKPNTLLAYLKLYNSAYTKLSKKPISGNYINNNNEKNIAALTLVASAMLNTDELLTKN